MGNRRDRFVDLGKAGMDRSLPGPDGVQSQTEQRLLLPTWVAGRPQNVRPAVEAGAP